MNGKYESEFLDFIKKHKILVSEASVPAIRVMIGGEVVLMSFPELKNSSYPDMMKPVLSGSADLEYRLELIRQAHELYTKVDWDVK